MFQVNLKITLTMLAMLFAYQAHADVESARQQHTPTCSSVQNDIGMTSENLNSAEARLRVEWTRACMPELEELIIKNSYFAKDEATSGAIGTATAIAMNLVVYPVNYPIFRNRGEVLQVRAIQLKDMYNEDGMNCGAAKEIEIIRFCEIVKQ